jgi:hypothetical protein
MNTEIEKLVKLAVADGQITEKERAVIIRKAQMLGEDIDEVEMILEGELSQKKNEQAPETHPQMKSNKEGEMKKCPSCGAPVPSFTLKCAECGYEFRNTESTKTVKDFYHDLKKAKLEDKSTVIANFPIPNNKEDLIEFLTLAVGNSGELSLEERNSYIKNAFTGTYKPELHFKESEIKAWQGKADAAIMKAKILFANDEGLLLQIQKFEGLYDKNKNRRQNQQRRLVFSVLGFVIIMMIILLIGLSSI